VVRAGLTLRLETVDEVFRVLLVLGRAHPAGGVGRSFLSRFWVFGRGSGFRS